MKKKYVGNNLSAYLNLEIHSQNLDFETISEEANVDMAYLTQLFQGYTKLSYNSQLERVVNFLNLDESSIFKRDLQFEKIRNQFYDAFFYCEDEKLELYEEVMAFNDRLSCSAYSIDILLIDYVFTVTQAKDFLKMGLLSTRIQNVFKLLSPYYQKLYSVFNLYYMVYFSKLDNILNCFELAKKIRWTDNQIEGRLYYIGFSIYRCLGDVERAKTCFFQAKTIFKDLNNISMLENLNMKYSSLLRSIGSINEALLNDLNLLESYTIKQYRIRNIKILFNNIGWTYSLLHNYKKAVIYYRKALDNLDDNDVYFNMAYCLYKIGEDSLSRKYIQRGRKAEESNSFARPFLDWLDLMIDEKYGEESFKVLINIKEKLYTDLEEIMRTMIQIEIVNYYYYNHMYEEAIHALQPLMGKQLISPSELIFTKKNENRNDLLFSEDELTLRSQMMESDDLFFEDDELGEDEWEELDDSFSRFTHN